MFGLRKAVKPKEVMASVVAKPSVLSKQQLADTVCSTFPVFVTSEDLEENPGFSRLLDDLCTKYNTGSVPVNLTEKLSQTNEELQQVKFHYMQQFLLHEALVKILLELENEEVKSFNSDSKMFQDVRLKLNCAEACNYLNVDTSGTPDVPMLFGLSPEFILDSSPAINQSHITEKVMPKIEGVLLRKSATVLEVLNKDSTNTLKCIETLGPTVEQWKQSFENEKRWLIRDKQNRNCKFWQCHESLTSALDLMSKLVNEKRQKEKNMYNEILANQLSAKCKALCLKARLLHLQVLCETYTTEAVEALKVIRSRIEAEESETTKELASATRTLTLYQSVGGKFDLLVEEYTRLKTELAQNQLVLNEVVDKADYDKKF